MRLQLRKNHQFLNKFTATFENAGKLSAAKWHGFASGTHPTKRCVQFRRWISSMRNLNGPRDGVVMGASEKAGVGPAYPLGVEADVPNPVFHLG